jgi:hypothetical protein
MLTGDEVAKSLGTPAVYITNTRYVAHETVSEPH